MRVMRSLAVGLMSVTLLVACGDGDDDESSQSATTVAPTSTTLSQIQLDKQHAQRIVLTAADVPDYTTDPPEPDDELSPEGEAAFNACADNNPLLLQDSADDQRGAESADFSKGDTITVGSSATLAETEDQARAAMTVLNGAAFSTCFSRALTEELRRDGTFTNVTVTPSKLPALTVGDQSVGYRFLARFRAGGQSLALYADTTFIRTGRALAMLDISSVGSAFPAAERSRLATAMAGRMAA